MVSLASHLLEEVTAHAQSDSFEDAREICADGTYFLNNLRTNNDGTSDGGELLISLTATVLVIVAQVYRLCMEDINMMPSTVLSISSSSSNSSTGISNSNSSSSTSSTGSS